MNSGCSVGLYSFLPLHLLLSAQCHMITFPGCGSVYYWGDGDKFPPVDFRYCKQICLLSDQPADLRFLHQHHAAHRQKGKDNKLCGEI